MPNKGLLLKAEVQPDREVDHLGREAVAGVQCRTGLRHIASYGDPRFHSVNLTVPCHCGLSTGTPQVILILLLAAAQ